MRRNLRIRQRSPQRAVRAGWLVGLLVLAGVASAATEWGPIHVAGQTVHPGTSVKMSAIEDRTFEASFLNMPIFVARGASPGPTLCLTAGVHGDELNGVEIARRAFAGVDPSTLRGTLMAMPAINAEGVRTGNRYLADRRDLNRAFPGRAGGSVAAMIAYRVFAGLRQHCDALIDLHTASNNRTNLPQIRADVSDPAIRDLAVHFGLGTIVEGEGPDGSLRREAAKAGIPAIIYEAGEPYRFQPEEIARGVEGVTNVMAHFGMIEGVEPEILPARIYEKSSWIRVAERKGGFFFPDATPGQRVKKGDVLGRVVDPLTDVAYEVVSTLDGEIVGMAVSQPVLSGYALFHIAWHAD